VKSWAARVTVELLIDDKVVARRREIRGAFVEHLPLDRKSLRTEVGAVARRAVDRIAQETRLLP
jgi:hypothetical protein